MVVANPTHWLTTALNACFGYWNLLLKWHFQRIAWTLQVSNAPKKYEWIIGSWKSTHQKLWPFSHHIHDCKRNVCALSLKPTYSSTWKWMAGILSRFLLGAISAYFHGQTLSFRTKLRFLRPLLRDINSYAQVWNTFETTQKPGVTWGCFSSDLWVLAEIQLVKDGFSSVLAVIQLNPYLLRSSVSVKC